MFVLSHPYYNTIKYVTFDYAIFKGSDDKSLHQNGDKDKVQVTSLYLVIWFP